MKAVRYHEYGDSSVLRYEDALRPDPGPDQALVKVVATTFNPVDAAIRAGFLRDVLPVRFPHTPGIEVSGTIAALGAGVDRFRVGDPVIGFLPMAEDGAAAEFVVVPAETLATAPNSVPLPDAAALPVGALTAWQALFQHADLARGQRVAINGAGGAVGGFAVQLAKQAGATVIATASARSRRAVLSDGADVIVDYTADKLSDAVTEPVDVLVNLVALPNGEARELGSVVRDGGVIVSTTALVAAGSEVKTSRMEVSSDADQLAALVAKVNAGELHLDISARYPLTQIAQVQDDGMRGQFRGKVLLLVDSKDEGK